MAIYNADESKGNLFRFDLLKPVIDRELRDRLPELLLGGELEFIEATSRVLNDVNPKALKLFETVKKEDDAFALKIICTIFTVADCNSVFPADFQFALVMLFLGDTEGNHSYAVVKRSLVARIDIDDGLLRVPICRAASRKDFEEGRYTIAWFTQNPNPS
ncbi:MAG: hypothetical protein Q7S83_01585 [bacterium]|nr:hypothetical protein [bacterium]